MLPTLDLREELQTEYTAQQELVGKVLTSGQQSAQQGQHHTMMQGGVDGQNWLGCCLRTGKWGGWAGCERGQSREM